MSEFFEVNGRKVVPLRTEADLDAAMAAGADIEYTACGNDYDMPAHPAPESGGWIPAHVDADCLSQDREWLRDGMYNDGDMRLRAFYPSSVQEAA
ncbi:MAG TPA: hypothetical protein VGE88_19080 [Lysobacter sp.]